MQRALLDTYHTTGGGSGRRPTARNQKWGIPMMDGSAAKDETAGLGVDKEVSSMDASYSSNLYITYLHYIHPYLFVGKPREVSSGTMETGSHQFQHMGSPTWNLPNYVLLTCPIPDACPSKSPPCSPSKRMV